jgi:hypothetical protein
MVEVEGEVVVTGRGVGYQYLTPFFSH